MAQRAIAKSIKQFQRLLQETPPPLVIKCRTCGKLRETRLLTDPTLLIWEWNCAQIGWNCESQEIVDESVTPSMPLYLPGSFVLARRADGRLFPGMIDYIPYEHPAFYKETADGRNGATNLVFNVSLLNGREEEYGSEWCPMTEVVPIEEAHMSRLDTDEARRKLRMCLDMQTGDVRLRLYRFSFMAHTNKLESPFAEQKPFVPVRHGPLNAVNLLAPGPSSRPDPLATRPPAPREPGPRPKAPQPQVPQPQSPRMSVPRPSAPQSPIPQASATQRPQEEQPPQQPKEEQPPQQPEEELPPQQPEEELPQQQPAPVNAPLPPPREFVVEIRPDLRAIRKGVNVTHIVVPYTGPPVGTPEAVEYLEGLAKRTGFNITLAPLMKPASHTP